MLNQLDPYNLGFMYNATVCQQMALDLARVTYDKAVDEYTRYILMLATLVIGLALLLLLKGKKNEQRS